MNQYPLNTKFLNNIFFNPKILIKFRNSLKTSLFQDTYAPTKNKRICRKLNVSNPQMANKLKVIIATVLDNLLYFQITYSNTCYTFYNSEQIIT